MESASIGSQAQVGPFARLRPGTTLSDAAHVGNFCEIKNASVGEGSKVNHLAYIGDATMGRDVNIGAGTSLVIMTAQARTKRPSVMMSLLDQTRALSRQ